MIKKKPVHGTDFVHILLVLYHLGQCITITLVLIVVVVSRTEWLMQCAYSAFSIAQCETFQVSRDKSKYIRFGFIKKKTTKNI